MRLATIGLVLLTVSAASAAAVSGLVFERGGSTIAFPGAPRAWCDRDALRVLTFASVKQSRWQLGIDRSSVRSGRALRFTWTRPSGVELFVFDAKTQTEASEGAEGSRGRVVLRRASCRRGGRVEIAIAAVLASELASGKPIQVSGTFVGRVGTRPS